MAHLSSPAPAAGPVQSLWQLAAVVQSPEAAPLPAGSTPGEGVQHWRHAQRCLLSAAATQQLELSSKVRWLDPTPVDHMWLQCACMHGWEPHVLLRF